jgi:hypothetical protein
MIEMENATVIDGNIVGNDLVLQTRDGTNINAGNVRGPKGDMGNQGTSFVVCTSTTRPTGVPEGYAIYETDTDLIRIWTGARWRLQEKIICTSAARPAGLVAADEGIKIYETDTNIEYVWTGTSYLPTSAFTPKYTNATARNNDIPTPIAGMVTWLDDVDRLEVFNGQVWSSLMVGSRIAWKTINAADVIKQETETLATVSFTLTSPRIIKVEGSAQYSVITTDSNGNISCRLGFDLASSAWFASSHALGLGGACGSSGQWWATLSAGNHTAEVRCVNLATTNCAARFTVGAGMIAVIDYGPSAPV